LVTYQLLPYTVETAKRAQGKVDIADATCCSGGEGKMQCMPIAE